MDAYGQGANIGQGRINAYGQGANIGQGRINAPPTGVTVACRRGGINTALVAAQI
ncbi:MAG: hypothetical protein K0S95_408 [Pantoea eucrina]|jgi:hypothetical protein|nr:hypothetical protein [Pantoea eucrina]